MWIGFDYVIDNHYQLVVAHRFRVEPCINQRTFYQFDNSYPYLVRRSPVEF